MNPESLIAEALATLCWRARVNPDDASPAAGRAVCDVLARDRMRAAVTDVRDPNDCPLSKWLQKATGLENPDRLPHLPLVLLGTERAVLMRPVSGPGERRAVAFVPLPAAVATAVRLIAELRITGLITEVA